MAFSCLAVSLFVTFGSGATCFAAMRLPPSLRRIVVSSLLIAVLCSPMIIPRHARVLRFAAVLATVSIAVRLYDSLMSAEAGFFPGPWAYFSTLFQPFALVLRRTLHEARPSRAADVRQTLVCSTVGLFYIDRT